MQGFNMGRYIPPEHEGTLSANQLAGKHALGARARKLKTEGILTVRFEMPFAVWCSHCPKPTIIGQGVRFNAEKKKIGNYYSTPIFSFRMKHSVCGGVIEITTDPKNTAYVVTEGGKQRDLGEDKVREGEEGLEILSPEEREKRREDAFAALEGKKQDQVQEKELGKRTRELYAASERDWDDPYEVNKRMRKSFRVGRKAREEAAAADQQLSDKMALHVPLLPEHEDDKARAGFVEFGALESVDDGARRAASRPLFLLDTKPVSVVSNKKKKNDKTTEAERRLAALQQDIRDNSRAAKDPFLSFASSAGSSSFRPLSAIKRKPPILDKKPSDGQPSHSNSPEAATVAAEIAPKIAALVAYDSDDST